MLNKNQFEESQKDCASILGISLKKYELLCKDIKITIRKKNKKVKYDNSILEKLGLSESDLKLV